MSSSSLSLLPSPSFPPPPFLLVLLSLSSLELTLLPFSHTQIPPSSRFYTQQGDTDLTKPFPNLTRLAPSLAVPPLDRSDDELAVKATWLAQLSGNATAQRFPNLKLVKCVVGSSFPRREGSRLILSPLPPLPLPPASSWTVLHVKSLFNYIKKGNATAEVIADFRYTGSATGGFNSTVEAWVRQSWGNQTAYEQGYTGAAGALRARSFAVLVAGAVAAVAVVV